MIHSLPESGFNPPPPPETPQEVGPWKRIASQAIYSNPWIHLREDKVLQPDGKPSIYGVVQYRNTAIGVVALDAQNQTVLVGQHRYPLDYYSWEIPEGGCLPDRETALEAAQRELHEEAGATAKQWNYLGCFTLSNSVSDEIAHLYLARDLTVGTAEPEPTEILCQKWIPFAEACRMAMEGEINESLSIVALARAQHFLALEAQGKPQPSYRQTP